MSTVGLDLAKHIFQLHGADSAGAVVFRKKLRRGQLLAFLATLPPCTVAMEACGSAHYWGREIAKLGSVEPATESLTAFVEQVRATRSEDSTATAKPPGKGPATN